MLKLVQHFDPQGISARSLAGRLLLQLEVLSDDTSWLAEASRLVEHHLELLANRDFSMLMRRLKAS